ncbi:MFS transporter [Methylocella sp.]|uniref:MFS transporter n=1 Tax=Methylocella sp. TaxID=1978226 RepID=UPI0037836E82
MTRGLTLFLAAACGLIVANLYFAQPVAADIGADLGMSPAAIGLIVTFTQLGYGLGLVLVAPLGDAFENRRLIACCLAGAALALAGFAFAPGVAAALAFCLLIGVACVCAQIIVPFAAHMAAEEARGQVVGDVMSGLMVGIMLSRPASSFMAHWLGWRSTFLASSALMAALALLVLRFAPSRRPAAALGYVATLRSLVGLARNVPALRRRSAVQAPLFAAFSLFWTAVPLLLTSPAFGLTQQGVALFALFGAGGAVAAPIVGRSRAPLRLTMGAAILSVALSFALAALAAQIHSLALLAIAALALDMGASANLILSQRLLFAAAADARSRLNALFIAAFFVGGALGSALSAAAYERGGWPLACAAGAAFAALALAAFLREPAAGLEAG